MMEDIEAGCVDCVIVKDLSRFGRDYIEAGRLIQKTFPAFSVRFIALNDNFDSLTADFNEKTLVLPVKNFVNDAYCSDISKKIRSHQQVKREKGDFIGAFAVYGYRKDPENINRLLVDEYAAGIVKKIFALKTAGLSNLAIAEKLDGMGILSPMEYKKSQGEKFSTGFVTHVRARWSAVAVKRILTNELYTGMMVQGKNEKVSHKVKRSVEKPKEEWVRVPNTHEAIITHETFDRVQALLLRDTRTAPKGRELHLFSGFLKCADCGKSVTRSQSGKNIYYACSTYKNRSRTACTMHSIKHNRLEAAVLFAIQYQVGTAVSYSEMIAHINTAPLKKSQSHRLNDQIAAKEKELTRITRYKQSLYQDWKDGEITQQEYREMKADYERQAAGLSDLLARLTAERKQLSNGVDQQHPALVAFAKYQNIEKLTREILIELVDHIKVYENGNISVHFKFADEFRKIAEYIEINTTDTAEAG